MQGYRLKLTFARENAKEILKIPDRSNLILRASCEGAGLNNAVARLE
jgi:hypothetical protein